MLKTFWFLFAPCYDYKEIYYTVLRHQVVLIRGWKNWLASIILHLTKEFKKFFRKIDCVKSPETLSQCLYACIRQYWVVVKQFNISNIANNHKFTKLFTTWMFEESFSYFWACIIDGFDMNWFTNLTWSKLELIYIYQAMHVCISQTCLKSHSLNFKVFSETVHLTFKNITRVLQTFETSWKIY